MDHDLLLPVSYTAAFKLKIAEMSSRNRRAKKEQRVQEKLVQDWRKKTELESELSVQLTLLGGLSYTQQEITVIVLILHHSITKLIPVDLYI